MASETIFTPPKIQKRTLKGHQKPVLCLAHSTERLPYSSKSKNDNGIAITHPSLLLSGSEDGTARLWDLRTRKTAYCMVIPRSSENEVLEVTSVAFHPSILDCSGESKIDLTVEEANEMVLVGKTDCTVYVGASNRVYGYDLRYHSSPSTTGNNLSPDSPNNPNPIITSPHFDLSNYFQCTDEINQLSFSYPKHNDPKKEYFTSAACDSGDVHICQDVSYKYNMQQVQNTTNQKVLHHADPESQAIASCSVFRPRVNEVYVASCGTDCTVKLWDIKKPRRAVYTTTIKPQEQNHNTTQLCNPPFVHSLSWSPSGRFLAAGLGDGSCLVLSVEGRKLVEVGRLGWDQGGHRAPVAAVCFPCFGLMQDGVSRKALMHGAIDDRLLISAGNDGNILFWDLGRDMIGCDAADPGVYLKSSDQNTGTEDVASKLESVNISSQPHGDVIPDDLLPSPPKVLFQIPHGKKTNWICCKRPDTILPSSLFVADTSNCISLYSLNLY